MRSKIRVGSYLTCTLAVLCMAGILGTGNAQQGKQDAVPTESEIADSIAHSRVLPLTLDNRPDFMDDNLWAQRMNSFVNSLASEAPTYKPAAHWRTLILFYPYTDTDYQLEDGAKKHYKGSLTQPQINRAVRTLNQMSGIVRRLSGGLCAMDVDLHVINRTVTFSGVENRGDSSKTRTGFQHPVFENDCAQEKKLYDDLDPHDNVIIFYYPGSIPQDLAGAGGSNGRQTFQYYQYGNEADWDPEHADKSCGGFIHEWIHGLDAYFMGRGYRCRTLHHLYHFPDGNPSTVVHYNWNWHAAILQGRMLGLTDTRYGYSRAAWMSGSISHPLPGPLPVQLLSPLPGVAMSRGCTIHFEWNPLWAPSGATGYRFRLYSADNFATPILTRDTRSARIDLPSESYKASDYLWTVQTFDGAGKLSPVGESFPIKIVSPSALPPIRFTRAAVNPSPFEINGATTVLISTSVSSPAGIRAVYHEITAPDGHVTRQPLHRESPAEDEPVWTGVIAIFSDGSPRLGGVYTQRVVAIDEAGRTSFVRSRTLIAKSFAGDPGHTVHAPIRARFLSPITLETSVAFDAAQLTDAGVAPAAGGIYPIQALIDPGVWDDTIWMEITGPDGAVQVLGLDHWYKFNGMVYGQCLLPPNETNSPVTWNLVFCLKHADDVVVRTQPMQIKQLEQVN